jgi:acyl-coenzyme A synthetase/AMP-(fatty) acid ligase
MLHSYLKDRLGTSTIHSEYGMTELLSQAYAVKEGVFRCPPWMKMLVGDEEDPGQLKKVGKGILHVIDLANIYSCAFIATEDIVEVYEDGSFSILGRADNSDRRGCSLLVV